MVKAISLLEIISFLQSDIVRIYGDPNNICVKYLMEPQLVDKFTLDWINPIRPDKLQVAELSKAKAIITSEELLYSKSLEEEGKVLIIVENPKLAIAKIGNHFFMEKIEPSIHPTAVIDSEAIIGDNAYIGAHAYLGKCEIGNNARIFSNVSIYDNVKIGDNVTIKPGAVLGYEGFGFEKNKNGELLKFPQLGSLIVGNNVEIGSNTSIDRGALANTIINDGVKINNLCHIAHNVKIGENAIITAHVNVSGSTTIRDNVWIAPNASLRGHQTIGQGAIIGMGSVVTKDVPANETWVGNPARPMVKK